ncbi:unnamed protein product, partial [Ixodes hexagonus]
PNPGDALAGKSSSDSPPRNAQSAGNQESVSNNVSDSDQDFDPSAEMLVDEYDDEKTLDEEEALESDASDDELNTLQKEGEMPLEDLLAMFGYKDGEKAANADSESEEDDDDEDEEEEEEEGEENEEEAEVVAPRVEALVKCPTLTSFFFGAFLAVSHASESSNSDSDEDFTIEEYWKKTIQVGSDYQATIPVGLCKYDDAPAYENEDRLLWDPAKISDTDVEDYLSTAQEPSGNAVGYGSPPVGSHTRDDEQQALYLLLQCGHNVEEALRRRRMNPALPTEMSLWSEEECRSFESGLRLYGKDFHLIQLHKVRTRSVAELVHFYYLWKKTERHDIFASKIRLEKKKYALHPGTTDYMDRFLDEQENSQQQQLQQQQQHQQQQESSERSCSPSEPKRPRLAGPLQLTSHLARHENGRDPTSTDSANLAFPRENGRGDRLWTGPESSSDEDDLPLIATARPPLAKTAATSPAVPNKATSSGTNAQATAPATQPAAPDE